MHRKSVGFKTLTITCLALALISTISLNIIRTYSINNTRTNALGSSSNYNSNSSPLSDPSAIRLSITNGTNSCSNTQLTNAGDVCINTPTNDAKVAVGSHTLTIEVGDYVDTLKVTLGAYSNGNNNYLVNQSDSSLVIPPTNGSLTNPQSLTASDHNVGSWGYAIPGEFGFDPISQYTDTTTLEQAKFAKVPQGYLPDTILQIDDVNQPEYTKQLYYGIRLNNPTNTQAGVYSQVITYTATATIPTPTLTRLLINDSVQQNQTSEFAIEGTNLDTVSSIKLCPTGQQPDATNNTTNTTNTNCYEVPNKDIDTYLDDTTTSTKGTVLSFTNPAISEPGTYDLYTISPVGQTKLDQPFIVQEQSICRNGDPNSDCQVDIDDNMIPIAYDEADQQWNIVTDNDLTTKSSWYDYTNKQWANAVTLRDDYEAGAVCILIAPRPVVPGEESTPAIDNVSDIYSSHVHDSQLKGHLLYGSDFAVSSDGTCSDTSLSGAVRRYTPLLWSRLISANNGYIESSSRFDLTLDNPDIRNLFNKAILGYWVYIPRYAYEVQRPNAIDRVVTDEYPLPDNKITNSHNSHSIRNEFSIHFETATDTKKTPAETCNILNPTKEQMWANGTPIKEAGPDSTRILAKDYRTGCAAPGNTNNISRLYTEANGKGNNTTWATHPAFTFGSTELNGLWIGKFETTGKVNAPTIKPNQHANVSENIGEFYTMARSIGTGTYDPANNGGNTISGITQNSHNLSTATSHMLKNSEWGAITYLASSKYGAGTNNVSINSASPSTSADADTPSPSSSYRWGITGCGPNNLERSTATYIDGTPLSASTIESVTACSTDPELGSRRAYNGDIGQLASTTNNVYGIYDMSGGASEYVMGNLTGYDDQSESSSTSYTRNPIKPPYVDLYKESLGFDSTSSGDTNLAWSYSTNAGYYNNDVCTWGTCGGHALHETKQYQSVSSGKQSWGGDSSYFVSSSGRWFRRGGDANNGSGAGLFYSNGGNGGTSTYGGFRSVLLAAP